MNLRSRSQLHTQIILKKRHILPFTIGFVMFVTGASNVGDGEIQNQAIAQNVTDAEKTETTTLTISQTQEYVENYFADAPIMAEIARCESTFRHTNPDGSILRGRVNGDDIGVMQINTFYHQDTADKLGIDIYTLEGNLDYARYLYETQGTAPWVYSSPCWGVSKQVAIR